MRSETMTAILSVQTSDNPERQYSPLVLSQTAKMTDIDAKVYFPGQALRVLDERRFQSIGLGAFPSVYEIIKKCVDMGIEMFVCEASMQMRESEDVRLINGLRVVGAATLNDLVLEADATMRF
ncbi:MAG: sulfur reduction protein DsrE [Candidatus Thorarchaeota archaeon]|nr:MAG: sulfur reduction protein DsrE [Candidatus Thorarchaeota archaeon]